MCLLLTSSGQQTASSRYGCFHLLHRYLLQLQAAMHWRDKRCCLRSTTCCTVTTQVTLCSICGSDLHPFHGRETGIIKGTIVGHEFVGTVVEMGSQVGLDAYADTHQQFHVSAKLQSMLRAQVKSLALGDRVMSPFTANCGSCFYCKRSATCR